MQRRKDLAPTQEAAEGGRIGLAKGELVEKESFLEGPNYPIEIGPFKATPRAKITGGETGGPYQGEGSPIIDKEIRSTDIGADMRLDIGKGIYGLGKYDKGRTSEDIYYEGEKVLEKVPRDHDIWTYGAGYEKDGLRAEVVYDPDAERYEFKIVKSFNEGGRTAFGLGSMSRRAFLK